MNLAAKLAALRKEKGLTQMDLAEQLNVSRQAISRWEVGAAIPSTDNLMVLAELYGVQIDYLLNDKITGNPESPHAPEDKPIITESIPKIIKNKTLLICFAAVVIVTIVLIFAFASQSEDPNQLVPMSDMYVESESTHSDGTFMIK